MSRGGSSGREVGVLREAPLVGLEGLPALERGAAPPESGAGLPLRAGLLVLGAAWLFTGCGESARTPAPEAAAPPPAARAVAFKDVTREAGIAFHHQSGAFGKKYLPETMGSGCAFLDYDGDGRVDLFFVNSRTWPGHAGPAPSFPALYRNLGGGRFEEVTQKARLAVESYGIGVAVGDFDNDGRPDLFVNALGPDHLYRNRGDGTFEDVTAKAGVSDPAFGSSATFLDYDKDGRLDLFVCNYVTWSEATDLWCTLDGRQKSYCTPESYKGASNRLFRNRGDGTFEDVSKTAGVYSERGKSLGVVAYDHDGDGWPDIAVANDTEPNYLYRNTGKGTFEEIGREAGIAYSETGAARGGMGIDAGDYDGAGRESIVIGNFANEMVALYHNEGGNLYVDDAASSGVGLPSLLTLAFGAFFFDYDLDGALDLFVVNGHVEPEINAVQKNVTYEEPPHLFRNVGGGKFREATAASGPDLVRRIVGRGAAFADIDGDGDLDIAVSTNGGPGILLRNDGGSAGHWLRVDVTATQGARDGFGTILEVTCGGVRQRRSVRAASSYCSQSEKTVTFGLGEAVMVDRLEVLWPSGAKQLFDKIPAGRLVRITEGSQEIR